jgi:hypothetical protein
MEAGILASMFFKNYGVAERPLLPEMLAFQAFHLFLLFGIDGVSGNATYSFLRGVIASPKRQANTVIRDSQLP